MRHSFRTGFVLLAALGTACGPPFRDRLDANKNLVREFAATIDEGDWDALDTLVAEDIRRHSRATSARSEIRSREAFKRHEQARHATWTDARVTYDILVAEGDMVAAYATFTGTQTGSFAGFPATGKAVETNYLAMFRIEDQRIAEIWVEWDNIATLRQLGLFPAPDRASGEGG